MNSQLILKDFQSLYPQAIAPGLERITTLLNHLGNPENHIPPVIHVAGTNGKGSVCAFIRAGLEAAGYRVHAYISPPLISFHEKIRIANNLITEQHLLSVLERVYKVAIQYPATFFELTTCAAMLAFAESDADYTILEVGMGGRYDATNIINNPAITVITPISIDHSEFLGSTLADISFEKCGIIKQHVPCISSYQSSDALSVIKDVASSKESPLFLQGHDFDAYCENQQLVYINNDCRTILPSPSLAGAHQYSNAGTSLKVLSELGVPKSVYSNAIKQAEWKGRLQKITSGPLCESFNDDTEIFVDGGHNAAAAHILAEEMLSMHKKNGKQLVIILGMMKTKDPLTFLNAFVTLHPIVYPVTIPITNITNIAGDPTPWSSTEITHIASRISGLSVYNANNYYEVPEKIAQLDMNGSFRILICGSLVLAGDVLAKHS